MASTAAVPEVALRSAKPMPVRDAIPAALEVGFRHFDTASLYGSERPPGRGRGRGAAAWAGGVPGGGVHHVQAVVQAVPPAPGAPAPPGKPPVSITQQINLA
jgi:hypothetical protein